MARYDLTLFLSSAFGVTSILMMLFLYRVSGVLIALCCFSNHPSYFDDVLSRVDVQNNNIHNSLAISTAILVGEWQNRVLTEPRHCRNLRTRIARVFSS